jgi:sugar-specific transcriptional regulator TrmB
MKETIYAALEERGIFDKYERKLAELMGEVIADADEIAAELDFEAEEVNPAEVESMVANAIAQDLKSSIDSALSIMKTMTFTV